MGVDSRIPRFRQEDDVESGNPNGNVTEKVGSADYAAKEGCKILGLPAEESDRVVFID